MAAYLEPRYKSKKAVKDGLKAGNIITVWDPKPWGVEPVKEGTDVSIVGPGPYERKWYATVDIRNDRVIRIK